MKFLTLCLAGSLIAAGAFAQAAPTNPPAAAPAPGVQARLHRGAMANRLGARLGLTPDQQSQVRNLFMQSRQEMRGLAPQLREERSALRAAVKGDAEPNIDQIVRSHADLNAQVKALHAKTIARVYALLTPDQKAKFDRSRRGSMRSQAEPG